jgi:anti-sigma-K factor RskA
MTGDDITDEMLMAYADGALDAGDRARIAALLETDPALAARLAPFTGTRDALAGLARRDAAEVALPPGLQARMMARVAEALVEAAAAPSDKVVALQPRGARRMPLWSGALAASLALAIGLGGGLMLGQGGGEAVSPVVAALDTLPSGAEEVLADGTSLRIIASFVSAEGALCREYEVTRPSGLHSVEVSCDAGAGWEVQLMLALEGSEGYMPASAPELLDLYYMQSEAGAPLSAEEEAAALSSR